MATACDNKKYKSFRDLPAMAGVKEVAGFLGVDQHKVYELVKKEHNSIPSLRMGKRIIIPKHLFRQWVENQAN